jgi:hypothetical protein
VCRQTRERGANRHCSLQPASVFSAIEARSAAPRVSGGAFDLRKCSR